MGVVTGVRARGHYPVATAVTKLLLLVLNLTSEDWKMSPSSRSCLAIASGLRNKIGSYTRLT
jgi:hypothetical protein